MKLCPKCNTQHEKSGTFCCRSCANSRGPRTEAFKKSVSAKLTGRELSLSTIEKMSGDNHPKRRGRNLPNICITTKNCLCCQKEFETRKTLQKYCSKICWMNKIRELKSDWEQYSIMCKFNFTVYDYPHWFDLSLIKTHGWYKAKNRGDNLTGISRDHMFSVKEGFRIGVDAKLISHPANCQLMPHSLNSTKHTKCSITYEELIERINNFNKYLHLEPVSTGTRLQNEVTEGSTL